MNEIVKRFTIEDIYKMKIEVLNQIKLIQNTDKELEKTLEPFHGHRPYRIDWRFGIYCDNPEEKNIDCVCWNYLVNMFHMEKYMLCTEYDKMRAEVNNFKTPIFNLENAKSWLESLKSQIHSNVKTMLKSVYDKIINGTYRTGSGYSNQKKKKRNNSEIDKWFILSTCDWNTMYSYWTSGPTITDDLEKACYILDGKTVPDITIKEKMKSDKLTEAENEYFRIRICKNGNTHYRIFDDTRNKLNMIGPDGNIIGEKIRIKVFDKLYGI